MTQNVCRTVFRLIVFSNKKPPSPEASFFVTSDLLAAGTSVAAGLRALNELIDTGETDEDIDDCLEFHPCAEEHVNDVPVCTSCEPSEADKTPVNSADDDENADSRAQGGFLTHRKMKGKE